MLKDSFERDLNETYKSKSKTGLRQDSAGADVPVRGTGNQGRG